jgi:radical SAM superfamily enzyme YgiQ (UPF0313 family)
MRVVLINPQTSPVDFEHHGRLEMPRSLIVLAAMLRQSGHDPLIVDMPALDLWVPNLPSVVRDLRPGLVGFPVWAAPVIPVVHRHILSLKAALGNIPTVVGGLVASILGPDLLHTLTSVDFVVVGDGEETLCELARALEIGASTGTIPGLITRRGTDFLAGPERPLEMNIDRVGLPAYDLIPMHAYREQQAPIWLETKRGCPFRCRFCSVNAPSTYGRARFRDPAKCVDEIQHVFEHYRIRDFVILDDTFNLSRRHAVAFCEEIIRRDLDIRWHVDTRADHLDPESLELMKAAGCTDIMMGVEVGSEDGLRAVRKDVSRERLLETFHMVRAAGMRAVALLITGLPTSTHADLPDTARWIQEAKPHRCNIFVFHPIPGADYFHHPKDYGLNFEITHVDDWRGLNYFSEPVCATPNLTRREIIEHYVSLNYAADSTFDRVARPSELAFLAKGPYPRKREVLIPMKVGGDYVYYLPDGPKSRLADNLYANVFRMTRFQYEMLLFCNGQHSVEEIAERMARLFDFDVESSLALTRQLLERFAALRMIEPWPAAAPLEPEQERGEGAVAPGESNVVALPSQ